MAGMENKMICRKRKIIFVHIPKCGGTSVEDCIWTGDKSKRTEQDLWMGVKYPFWKPTRNKYQTGGLQHLTAQQIRQEIGHDLFCGCFRFAVVREPLARIVSQYKYMKRRHDLRKLIKMNENDSFSHYLDLISKKSHVQWKPQADFILDRDGSMLVDRVYRLEDISTDMSDLSRNVGLDFERLPKHNTTADMEPPVITNADREEVAMMFRKDYEILDYAVSDMLATTK
ncbi:sulfotransferase family 2 domain-containing protein [Stakelama marina]|uniref:Sulfotransferase family 2 domain-containing protein n=1 Tax=Stakelama marina TaxID=2826939 RepID=A0A8T4ICC7_9SPHN|nr:sulfotransferase family 2 domain-containing protein [Stakelama marina]MBR0552113.1 sulfotransferase family 2 domain-containing protein [Stakelama marina]